MKQAHEERKLAKKRLSQLENLKEIDEYNRKRVTAKEKLKKI